MRQNTLFGPGAQARADDLFARTPGRQGPTIVDCHGHQGHCRVAEIGGVAEEASGRKLQVQSAVLQPKHLLMQGP